MSISFVCSVLNGWPDMFRLVMDTQEPISVMCVSQTSSVIGTLAYLAASIGQIVAVVGDSRHEFRFERS